MSKFNAREYMKKKYSQEKNEEKANVFQVGNKYSPLASKKEEGTSSSSKTTSTGFDASTYMKKKLAQTNAVSDFGLDTLQSDLTSLSDTIGSVFNGWQTRETMDNALSSVQSMYDRLGKYQEYQKKYGGADLSDVQTSFKSVIDGWEDISKHYGQYKDADTYNNALKVAKEQAKEYEGMKTADLGAVQTEISDLEGILKTVKEHESIINGLKVKQNTWGSRTRGMSGDDEYSSKVKAAEGELSEYLKSVGYESVDALKKALGEKKVYKNKAEWMQKGIEMSSVGIESSANYDKDFKEKATYMPGNRGYNLADDVYEFINGDEDKKIRMLGKITGNADAYLATGGYEHMTDQEKLTYNYYYNQLGKDKAEEYLNTIAEDLANRKALDRFEQYEGKLGAELLFGVEAGLDQFATGLKNLVNTKDEYIPINATQQMSGLVRQDINYEHGDIAQIGYDLINTTSNMLPSILTSAVISKFNPTLGANVGSALMGASASGNAYQEMLNLGYDKSQSRVYSAVVGASEAYLQKVLGGIGALGGTGGKISNAVKAIDNAAARFAIQWGGSIASEALEEGLQEVLTPFFKNFAAGYDTGAEVDWGEVFYSALLGGLSGGMLEGPSLAVNTIAENSFNKSMGKTIKANERVPEVFDIASNPEVASAYETYTRYANKGINADNITDAQLGSLYTSAYQESAKARDSKKSTAEQVESAEKRIADLDVYGKNNPSAKVNKRIAKDAVKDEESIKALIESGLESGENTESFKLATEYQAKLDSGKKLSTNEISKLVEANEKALKAEESKSVAERVVELGESTELADIVTRKIRGEALTTEEAEKVLDSDVAQMVIAENGNAENVTDELISKAKTMDKGKGALFIALYDGETDIDAYANAFNLVATKAENNFTFDNILQHKNVLSGEQISKIYSDVRIKADHEQKLAFQKIIEKTADLKAYKAVIDESAIDYDNTSAEGKVNWKDLTDRQRKAVTFIKGFAQATGMNVTFVANESYNGKYDRSENTIYINLDKDGMDAITHARESVIPTMSHELTHWMEKKSPVLFRKMNEIVFSTLQKFDGLTENERIAKEITNTLAKEYKKQYEEENPGKKISVRDARKLIPEDVLNDALVDSKRIEVARSEIIARACEDMLSMSEQGKKMFNSLSESEQKTFVEKIKELIQNLKDWVSDLLGLYKSGSHEAKVMRAYEEDLNELLKVWDAMLEDSVKVNQALEKSGAFGREVTSIGARDLSDLSGAVDLNGNELFQYKAMVEDEDIYREMLLEHKDIIGISNSQIAELFTMIDKAVDIISNNLEALDYAWEVDINDRAFSPVKPNSDSLYKVSLDFSTLCRKRLLQQTIQQTLQNALDKNLSTEESIAIRDELIKIQEEGRKIEVACALCYVESARMKSPKQINKFLNSREAVIKEFFANRSGGSIKEKIANAEMKARKELQKANPNGLEGKNGVILDALTAPKSHMKKADAEYIRDAGKKAKSSYKLTEHEQAELEAAMKMSIDDFASAKGLENLAKNHPDIFDAYTSFVRNATHSKGIENDTWWRAGDSDSIGDALIERMNAENGLRSQSWSDFQVIHLLDYIAATIELSTKGAKRQSYTKVPDYVKLLGNTGDMINISLIPERVFKGKLTYDSVEGMAYDIAKQLRDEYHETVGTVCIGINNEQIKMLLEDATIDYVIPYHHSSMSKAVRKLMHIPAWETYQNYQGEKKLSDTEAKARARENGVKLNKDSMYQKAPNFSEWFNLDEARQIAKLENEHPSNMDAYKKYGKMYGGYMAMQNAANKYLKLCAERGLAPKFSSEKADFTHDANYWKLLIDRKMVDNVTGEIIEQKPIKPIFNEKHVLEILNDELARYPQVKADQEYAQRKVVEKFLSGDMKVDKSTLDALKSPIDNIAAVNILESAKDGELLSEKYTDGFVDSIVKSFGIEKLGDYIHVQRQVLNTLVAENFFTDAENRKRTDVNKESGMIIETNKSGIDETFNLKNFARIGKNKKITKLATIRRLPEIIENGRVVNDNVPNQHGNNDNKKFAYIEYTCEVDGKEVTIRIDIKKSPQKNKFWVHRVWEKENVSNFPASANEGAEAGHTKADINKTISHPEGIVKELHSDKDSEGNVLTKEQVEFFKDSNVRDADGNLLVCYHGTEAKFSIFNYDFISQDNKLGFGFYFMAGKELQYSYKYPLKCYLNIKNPITDTSKNLSKEALTKFCYKLGIEFEYDSNDYDLDVYERLCYSYTGKTKDFLKNVISILGVDGILSQDRNVAVAFNSNQIKSVTNTNPTESDDILYSEKEDTSVYDIMGEMDRLKKENEQFKADVERLQERLKLERQLTHGNHFNENQLGAVAGHLRNIAKSSYDKVTLMRNLRDVYSFIAQSPQLTWNEVFEKCCRIAASMLEESKPLTVTDEYTKMILQDIRNTKISLSETQKQEAKYLFGKHWNRSFFGNITITDNGVPLESIWQDWAEKYPHLFDTDITEGDMVGELYDTIGTLRDASEILVEYDEEEQIRWLAREIYNQYWNVSNIKTTADKYDKKIKLLNFEHRKAMAEFRSAYEDRVEKQKLVDDMYYRRKMSEQKGKFNADLVAQRKAQQERYQQLYRDLRERKDEQIALAKKHGRDMVDRFRDNAERKTRIQSITSNVLSLKEMLVKNSKDKHIPEVMKGPVKALIDAIDFSSKRLLEKGVPTQKDISLQNALRQVSDMVVANNSALDGVTDLYGAGMDAEIKEMMKSVDRMVDTLDGKEFVLQMMSAEDLKTLDKMVKVIKSSANKLNKFHVAQYNAGVEALGVATAKDVDDAKKIYKDHKKHFDKLKTKTYWNQLTPYYAFKNLGKHAMKIMEALMDGQDKVAFLAQEVIDFAESVYTDKEYKKWSKTFFEFEIRQPSGRIAKFSMNVPQIMSLYCVSKQEDAKRHLLHGVEEGDNKGKGRGITIVETDKTEAVRTNIQLTEADLNNIIAKLNEVDRAKEVADKLQEFMGTRGAELGNEISMARWGIKSFGIENYFPIKVSDGAVPNKGETPGVQGNPLIALLNMAFTHARNQFASQSIEIGDVFDVFSNHMASMIQYNAMALPVLDMYKWMNCKVDNDFGEEISVQTSIKNTFGDYAWSYFDTFLKDVNGSTKNDTRDNLGIKFFKNAKVAKVAANIRVAFLQFTSYIRAGAVMDNKYLLRAILYKPKVKKSMEHCGIALWKSLGYYETDITRPLTDKIKHAENVKDKIITATLKGAELADKITWGYLWNACELEVRDTRKDLKVGSEEFNKEVGLRLREVVYRTQVVDSQLTRSQMMRSQSGWDKILTTFASESTLSFNLVSDLYVSYKLDSRRMGKQAAKEKNQKYIRKAITAYVVTNVVTTLLASAFDAFRDYDEDDKDEEYITKLLLENFATNTSFINKIPYVNLLISIISGFSASRVETDWMESAVKGIKELVKYIAGEGSGEKAFKHLLKAASDATGIAGYNLYREAMALYNFFG